MKLVISVFLFLSISVSSHAENNDKKISDKKVDNLITTIEDPEKRQDFIENLETIIEVEEKDSTPSFSEVIKIEEKTEQLVNNYESFLSKHNLNETLVGRVFLSAMSILLLIGVLYAVSKLGDFIRSHLQAFKRKYYLTHNRFRLYARLIRYCVYAVTIIFFIFTLGVVWGISSFDLFENEGFNIFFGRFLGIFVVGVIGIAVWETINGVIEYNVGKPGHSNLNRLRTLLPIIKNMLFIVFFILFSLVILSEIGVDILPLLAGAGVVGIAIGFGAQTVVKDFITGFTVIFEDLIQVGDIVKVGDRMGRIEKITIRKVQLRDLEGIVYTVPFSEIKIIENWTKEYSYYLIDVGIAYREDPEEVIGYLKEIDENVRQDDEFKDLILEPIEVLGVDHFADSAVIIKARIKTLPIKQWDVGREFNKRMKAKFDQNKVEMPFPHQTIYFGENKDGSAPAAPITVKKEIEEHREKKNKD